MAFIGLPAFTSPQRNGLSQQYNGLGGRARELFNTGPKTAPALAPSQKRKAPSGAAPSMKKAPSAPLRGPVSKQKQTLDKFFGSFDTP